MPPLLILINTSLVSLRRNLMRSILTMLGIIIGIGAVVVMVALGQGAQQQVEQQINSLGSNLLMVRSGASRGPGGARGAAGSQMTITERDIAALQSEIPEIEAIAGYFPGRGQVVVGNINWNSSIYGAQPGYLVTNNWTVESGRTYDESDERTARKVALIGATLAEELFSGLDPIGQSIRINKVSLEIIGVLGAKGQDARGNDQDEVVLIPLSTAKRRVLGITAKDRDKVSAVSVKVAQAEDMEWVSSEVSRILDQRHRVPVGETRFSVRNLSEFMAARAATSQVFNTLLAGVAAVSLLVGGIGVMNIMLVSVTERTREIGLRMAVGATPTAILVQFLVESVVLCVVGAFIGITLSVATLAGLSQVLGWPVALSPTIVLASLLVTGTMGIFFGFYPAYQAARLAPLDALRYE